MEKTLSSDYNPIIIRMAKCFETRITLFAMSALDV